MTIEERFANLELRLERVKLHNRSLTIVTVIVAGLLLLSMVFGVSAFKAKAQGAGMAKEIRANRILLEDEDGKTRVLLTGDDDKPGLYLIDAYDTFDASFAMGVSSATLKISDRKSESGVALKASPGGASLILTGGEKPGSMELFAGGGGSSIRMTDDRQSNIFIMLTPVGPLFSLSDHSQHARIKLSAHDFVGPSLSLYDENQNTRFTAGCVHLASSTGKKIEYPESSLILYGPDGSVIWSALK